MADSLKNLNKKELQDKCSEFKIEFVEDNTKAELTAKLNSNPQYIEVAKAFEESEEIKSKEGTADDPDEGFDNHAYERVSFLSLDAKRRKGGRLSKDEEAELKELKPKAYANKGLIPIVTDTYRVGHRLVRLIEGLPTPKSVVDLFSKYGQEKLFS